MLRLSWVLVLVTMIVGVIGFGGYAAAHAATWQGVFALFVLLSLVSFLYEYRDRCCR